MKTYMEYSEKERANLTEEEVKALLDLELMIKGIEKVTAPTLEPIQDVSAANETLFEVGGIYFETMEDAEKFLSLNPRASTYDYGPGYNYQYTIAIKPLITQTKKYLQQSVLELSSVLKQNKSVQERNEKLLSDYTTAKKEQDAILDVVWKDWWRCKDRECELQKIRDIKKEYLKMTEGNDELAMQFLEKIHSVTDINEALN